MILATDDEPIGIDIEKIDQKRNFLKIANRLKFKNCRTVQDFYKYFTAYEAEFKLGKEYQKPYHLFFEREDFMICVATLSKKSIETITQKNFL